MPDDHPESKAGSRTARFSRQTWVTLTPALVPAVLMLLVGLVRAGRPTLSWDEASTADIVRRTPGQIWALIQHVDAVLGPYYFLMHAWSHVAGESETALRLPSIVAMAAAVGLAGELGRRLFTPAVGLLAGVLLCLVPNTSRYAAEARPYAFTCLFSVLAVLLLVRALERPRRRRWAAYAGVVVLLGASHLIALSTLVAHGVAVWAHHRKGAAPRAVKGWVLSLAAAVLVLSPVVLMGVRHRSEQLSWVEFLTRDTFLLAPGEIFGASNMAWLLIGLAVLARWRPREPVRLLAVLALAPPVLVAAASLTVYPLWVPRYLLVILTPLAILAAVALVGVGGWATRRGRWGALARVGGVVLLLAITALPGHGRVRSATAKNGPDYRGVAAIIEKRQSPGDVIVFETDSRALRAGMDYYLRLSHQRPTDVLQRRSAADVGELRAAEYAGADAAARLTSTSRVWLVVGGDRRDPTALVPAVQGVLREKYVVAGLWHRNEATVALYRAR
ncbi:glycosyltransferase family 39 protein [Actinoplanes sp. NPDC051859]|uniref:glycosyltransferase family 39 protein n=1 Tax=Actinoplanes sp. NPDC051859 TaxID=3363909 RepID=UPI0037A5EB1C